MNMFRISHRQEVRNDAVRAKLSDKVASGMIRYNFIILAMHKERRDCVVATTQVRHGTDCRDACGWRSDKRIRSGRGSGEAVE